MASKKITLTAEKQYSLPELKEMIAKKISSGFTEFVNESYYQFDNAEVMLLTYEKYYIRNSSYAGLTVLLTERSNHQTVDITSIGGKETFFSFGAESNFANDMATIMQDFGFIKI